MEFGFTDIIRAEMEEAWISRGAIEGVSVWLEDIHSGTNLYFSPVASEIAKILLYRFNGKPCDEPSLENLTFMLGSGYLEDF